MQQRLCQGQSLQIIPERPVLKKRPSGFRARERTWISPALVPLGGTCLPQNHSVRLFRSQRKTWPVVRWFSKIQIPQKQQRQHFEGTGKSDTDLGRKHKEAAYRVLPLQLTLPAEPFSKASYFGGWFLLGKCIIKWPLSAPRRETCLPQMPFQVFIFPRNKTACCFEMTISHSTQCFWESSLCCRQSVECIFSFAEH